MFLHHVAQNNEEVFMCRVQPRGMIQDLSMAILAVNDVNGSEIKAGYNRRNKKREWSERSDEREMDVDSPRSLARSPSRPPGGN